MYSTDLTDSQWQFITDKFGFQHLEKEEEVFNSFHHQCYFIRQ